MSFPSQDRRADEKLGRILGRVGAVRTRLNSLALQHAIFYTLAIAISSGAVIFACAYLLSPLMFLVGGSAIVIIAAVGIASAVAARWATPHHPTPFHAGFEHPAIAQGR